MKKLIMIICVIFLALFVIADTVIIPAENENISIDITAEDKAILRDYYRKPSITIAEQRNNYDYLAVNLNFEQYNGTDWLPNIKKLVLWTDYNKESKYCSNFNYQFNVCSEFSHYTHKDLARRKIAEKVGIWKDRLIDRLTEEKALVDIGNKTIDLNG